MNKDLKAALLKEREFHQWKIELIDEMLEGEKPSVSTEGSEAPTRRRKKRKYTKATEPSEGRSGYCEGCEADAFTDQADDEWQWQNRHR